MVPGASLSISTVSEGEPMIYVMFFLAGLFLLSAGVNAYCAYLKYRLQQDELVLFGDIRTK